jgi:polyphosphate kinase 2
MSKHKAHHDESSAAAAREEYDRTLYELRVQLVKLQNHVIRKGLRLAIMLEGRDGAGKDGAIKRIVKNMSPRETRIVALGKPSDRDQSGWYFQRWAPHLPTGGEIVLFNRSWYNRAGVESVMGFCTAAERESFLEDAPRFEDLLLRSGMTLRKYYLDISKAEQKRRLASRKRDPLTQWKVSPIDEVALRHWNKYSEARDEMLARTSTARAPWVVIGTDDKRAARIGVMKALLASVDYRGKDERLLEVDRRVVWRYDEKHATEGHLAR